MDTERLRQLLEKIKTVRVAVIGDVCLDAYWHVDMRQARLSRETPFFNRPVTVERYSCGAAGNVAACALALGCQVSLYSLVGDDWRGTILSGCLRRLGLDLGKVQTVSNWSTPAYIKPRLRGYESEQEIGRLDFIPAVDPPQAVVAQMGEWLLAEIGDYQAVLVNEQMPHGVLRRAAVAALEAVHRNHPGTPITVDARIDLRRFPAMIWKPNLLEAARLVQTAGDPAAWPAALVRLGAAAAVVTAGADGCHVSGGHGLVAAPKVVGPTDSVGAGDAFHAGLAAGLAAGADLREAAQLGCVAAAVTVRKIGQTGTATMAEILQITASVSE